jgi:hypothetical protein
MKTVRLKLGLLLSLGFFLASCSFGTMGLPGYGTRGRMMGGGIGMMGGGPATIAGTVGGASIGLAAAKTSVLDFLTLRSDPNLVLDELIEFSNGFYALVKERDTGKGAFELLVDRSSGAVTAEPGPNMMWNAKYGMMGSLTGNLMMGGVLGTSLPAQITAEAAKTALSAWLVNQGVTASYVFDLDEFYGYYTIDLVDQGSVVGMASVNASTGQLWYHSWHGAFVAIRK